MPIPPRRPRTGAAPDAVTPDAGTPDAVTPAPGTASTDTEYTGIRLDSAALKVLAHPLRSRLLSSLRTGGPATATDLAAALGTNSGATSYHLRRLESIGLVADTGEGEGKRRLWRAATHSHSYWASDVAGDEDAETALNWLSRDYVRHLAEQYERWLDVEEGWPLEWRDAAGLSDSYVIATAAQVEDLRRELTELVGRYRRIGQGNPDARRVATYSILYPLDLDRAPRGAERT